MLSISIGIVNANTTITSNERPTCDEVLKLCDNAVNALEAEVYILKDLNQGRKNEIERLRKREDSWSSNRWLWLGAGLLIGVAGGVYLAK